MKMAEISLIEWQKKYGTEENCAAELAKVRWPDGYYCPKCGHEKASYISTRHLYQCCRCRYQVSVTAGTIFHASKVPLVKWFWAIYLTASDKGGISALRLSKQIQVSWITAYRMLTKIRTVMAHRDSIYRLNNFIELDDAYVGGKKPGKRGRGASGKKPILVAVENIPGKYTGFAAMQAVDTISHKTVEEFLKKKLVPSQKVRTDALPALTVIGKDHEHESKVTPPEEAGKWLPMVHIIIGNMKAFINGTFHGVSGKYLQSYLDEFCYRFNRRFWEPELPLRLLNACLAHTPAKVADLC